MKNYKSSIIFSALIFLFSIPSLKANDSNEKRESGWLRILKKKKLSSFRSRLDSSKTTYPEPFLTIHLGASYATNTGNVQNNSGEIPGTMINVRDDIGLPKSSILPRVNAIVNFGNFHVFAFDTYNVLRRGDGVIDKDIKYGDAVFSSGSPVKSRLSLNYVSLSYINFFYNTGRSRVAFLAGVTGIFYNLRITNTELVDFSQRRSLFVPLPTVGLNGCTYLTKRLFVRAVVKYSAWWSKNYNCNVLDINPYFEYYLYKNFGVGMRYNLGYTNIQNLPDNNFAGSVKNTYSALSAVLVYRFLKKNS